jgi:hypothetical protein
MDNAPWFDTPDLFNQQRIRLADSDGSGTTDIFYLGRDCVTLFFNQSGNGWSAGRSITAFPATDNLASIAVVDLLGNGTACLVWSSLLPGDARRPMRYIDLMGGQKPHLLTGVKNNLGAETRVQYAPSTKFYAQDRAAGRPWITRLPFPVHVVERVETYDRISRNLFVSRYAYHHGYFDGIEREFRGFGMVEQWDTEEFAALSANSAFPAGDNLDSSSHVPPVLIRTWSHTGAYLQADKLSLQFSHEYYGAPKPDDPNVQAALKAFDATLLPDTLLPEQVLLTDGTAVPWILSAEEERQACRALKGSILRQEIFACDSTDKYDHPYVVSERNYTIGLLQPQKGNRHAVFLKHLREKVDCHYERDPGDPRISHDLMLAVDAYGNVRKSAAIGYGRKQPDSALAAQDQGKQAQTLITCTENGVTNTVDIEDDYRVPLLCESRTYELTGLSPGPGGRFDFDTVNNAILIALALPYEATPSGGAQKRLIEHVRMLYRRNDLAGPLPLEQLDARALPFESYKLVLTPGLLTQVYGERVTEAMLKDECGYVHSFGDTNWWVPSGQVFYSAQEADTPAQELAEAKAHFFRPRRFKNPFDKSHA